jgi:protease IV
MSLHHPSLWRSSLSTFFRTVAAILGVVVSLFVVAILFGLLISPQESSQSLQRPPYSLRPLIQPNLQDQVDLEPGDRPLVLKISIQGIIGTSGCDRKWFDQIWTQLHAAPFNERKPSAILLVMNTPGGAADDSVYIHRRLLHIKEQLQIPVIAQIEGICASGGMYIACAADKILAGPEAIVGSIGVLLGPTFNVVQGMHQLGIESFTLTEGTGKDAGNPFRTWTPDEFMPIRQIAEATYDSFVRAVAEGRPLLTTEKIRDELGARIFVASEAERVGLLDSCTADRYEALLAIATELQEEDFQVVEFQPPLRIFEELIGLSSQAVRRVTRPWLPQWAHGMEGRLLMLSPSLAGE